MKALAARRGVKEADLVGRVLCQDIRGERREIIFRKGHALRADDIPMLIAAPWSELHLLELGPEDVGQREAGQRLANAVSRADMQIATAGHRHVLKSKQKSLLEIDVEALRQLNSIPGIAVFTLLNDQVVSPDEVVAEAQITPLAIERRFLEQAERIARDSSIVHLLPFAPREVSIWMRDDRLRRPLTEKLHWFECPILDVIELPRDAEAIRESMERSRATLFVVSGSNALDPIDPVFQALEQMGTHMQRNGLPVHPGTLLWIASWRAVTIIGLPSCGLGPQVTAFDLVLPKLLAKGFLSDEDLAALGHGGILRFARARAREQEPVDAPVR